MSDSVDSAALDATNPPPAPAPVSGEKAPVVEGEVLDQFMTALEARGNPQNNSRLQSGFRHFNQAMHGLSSGLYVFAGPPACGKTSFFKQLGDQIAKLNRIPVLFFSFEQSAAELRIRSLARLGKINSRDVSNGDTVALSTPYPGMPIVKVWDQVRKAVEEYREIGKYQSIIEADSSTTIEVIAQIARATKARAEGKRLVIIIDSLQSIPAAVSDLSSRDLLLCSELRRLARAVDAAVFVVVGAGHRAYANNIRPTLGIFGEAGAIENCADVIGAFWTNPSATAQFANQGAIDNPDYRRSLGLFILKNRFGDMAQIKMVYQPDLATFAENDRMIINYPDNFNEE